LRPKFNNQPQFEFQPRGTLQLTEAYYAKYDRISQTLDAHPELVDPVHRDVAEPDVSEETPDGSSPARFKCSSESVLRILICMIIEGCSLRQITVRIDDSGYLRSFVRMYNDPMIDFTTLCRLKNRISPESVTEVNRSLTTFAAEHGLIEGERLRMDTTAVETNIHWPTDSSLLWDTYRTLARFVKKIRKLAPHATGDRRLLKRKAKRLHLRITRRASGKNVTAEDLESLYFELIQLTQHLMQWCHEIVQNVQIKLANQYPDPLAAALKPLIDKVIHYEQLGKRVIQQAWTRVIEKKAVANDDKIFSIFEPHTELLKRGKAGKDIEFGHMIQIEQVECKFVTRYEVFDKKPVEHRLVEPAIEDHKELFGSYPDEVSADKGYYENMDRINELSKKIEVVSIAKKGNRSDEETEREKDPAFRDAQRFRAGAEGSISFLKRVLGLARCYNKGWSHYAATVGLTILTHNLLILARC